MSPHAVFGAPKSCKYTDPGEGVQRASPDLLAAIREFNCKGKA